MCDLESVSDDAIPITIYKPSGDHRRYDQDYTHWEFGGRRSAARDFYRIAWRRRAANTGERTLMSAIIPPGTAHVHNVYSLGKSDGDPLTLPIAQAVMGSIIADFAIRCVPKDDILLGAINRLPWITPAPLMRDFITLRSMRLASITTAFSELWSKCYIGTFKKDSWVGGHGGIHCRPLGQVTPVWNPGIPLRTHYERRQAIVEIDALVALMLGLSADELGTIYRTQFSVLYGNDRNSNFYDANGRLIPATVLNAWRNKRDRSTVEERTATNQAGKTYTYELPFVTLDREADMRQAYAVFQQRLRERQ